MKHKFFAVIVAAMPFSANAYTDGLFGLEKWRKPALYAVAPIALVLIVLFIVLGRRRSHDHESEE